MKKNKYKILIILLIAWGVIATASSITLFLVSRVLGYQVRTYREILDESKKLTGIADQAYLELANCVNKITTTADCNVEQTLSKLGELQKERDTSSSKLQQLSEKLNSWGKK